jgi:hypothetical protein
MGLLLAAWDVAIPAANAYVLGLIIARYQLDTIAAAVVVLAVVGWLPYGNGIPIAIDAYDLCCFRLPMLRSISVRVMRAAAALPLDPGKQPVLQQGRDNLARFVERCVREVPQVLRAALIFGALAVLSPPFAPWLLACGLAAGAVSFFQFRNLRPCFRARQDAEDIQRDWENLLTSLPPADALPLLDAYEIAVDVRFDLEREVGLKDLRYKFMRDLVFWATLVTVWLWGAYYVIALRNPPETFLVVIQWGGKVSELFGSLISVQNDLLRIRPSIMNLCRLVERNPA